MLIFTNTDRESSYRHTVRFYSHVAPWYGLVLLLLCGRLFAQAAPSSNVGAAIPADAPTVDEIIARYVEARGGLDKLHAINTLRMTKTVTFKSNDPGVKSDTYVIINELKRPNLYRMEIRLPQGTYQVDTYDGAQGWTTNAKTAGVKPLAADASRQPSFRDNVEAEFIDYQQKGYKVVLRGPAQEQGRDCYGLLTTKPNGMVTYRCLDKTTFLDLERRDENSTTVVSDFRPVAGVLFPHRMEIMSQKGTWIYATDKLEVNVTLDDVRFQKPEPLQQWATAAVTAGGETFERVQWARQTAMYAIQHVRTCAPGPFQPVCSFGAMPERIKFTKDRIEFWAPLNKAAGGPHAAFIDLKNVPKLTPKMREGWRVLDSRWWYYSFDPTEKNYDAASSNILWGKAKLEWKTVEEANQFLKALEILAANARSEVDAEEREEIAFAAKAREWKALLEKPPLPDGVHREEVLAKNAITQERNPELALEHFERGLAIEPLWPVGQLGAATICGELQRYECALEHGERYLEMLPDGPQADVLRDKVIIWKDKLGRQ